MGSQSQTLCTGVTLAATPAGPQPVGTSVTLTASGATCGGGETAEYRFFYIKDGTSTPVDIRTFGTSATTTWNTTGLANGSYQLIVYARAVGSTAAYQSFAYATGGSYSLGNVCNNTTSFTASPTAPQPVGTMVSLTSAATCTGGTAEFRYAYKAPGAASFVFFPSYGGATQTWNTTGLPVGSYTLLVYTRAAGNTSSYESYRYASYSLGGAGSTCSGATIGASPAGPQPVGTTLTLTGSATCTSPQFRFSYRASGAPSWINIGTWGAAMQTWSTAGLTSGVYELLVEARQAGNIGAAESLAVTTYALGNVCSSVSISANPASPQGPGIVVTLTGLAACSGGATAEYRFLYQAGGAGAFTQIRGYGAASANWDTTGLAAGAYTVRVEARAVGSTAALQSAVNQSYTLATSNLTQVGAGFGNAAGTGDHVCARVNNGTARCWGANDAGQLGNGSVSALSSTPVQVSGLTNVVSVSAGGSHSCALLQDSTVRCWGANTDGQLGNNSLTSSSLPVVVTGLTDATALTVGTYHTCALRSGGAVSCWGNNSYYQTASATAGDFPQTKAPAAVSGITGASAVYAAGFHTCALVSGGLKCWGDNSLGQLGNGGSPIKSLTPVDVTGLTSGVTSMAAGDSHSCALVSGGARCWGDGTYGQLGNGVASATPVTTPVTVTGLSGVVQLAAGFTFSCARLGNGTIRCWGRNQNGEVGDGTGVDRLTPTAVSGISNASQITAGFLNGCAILTSGSPKCWGYGASGALGNGTSAADALAPVVVSFP